MCFFFQKRVKTVSATCDLLELSSVTIRIETVTFGLNVLAVKLKARKCGLQGMLKLGIKKNLAE